jgi:hypothetical protein
VKDKIVHAGFGFFITLVIGFIFRNSLIGFLAGCFAGAAKEFIWDWWLKKGTPELFDFLATCMGASLGFAFLLFAGL